MARELVFQTNRAYPFSITKLDRTKLYGWKDVVAFDNDGNECVRVDVDASGSFIIPKGGKALGVLDDGGNWVDRKDLKAVYKDGSPAMPIPSSFDQPIELKKKVSVEEFLSHSITYVYILQSGEVVTELIEQIKNSDEIYTFPFNYRAGYDSSAAFLLESDDSLFMLVGYTSKFEFIGLEEVTNFNAEEDEFEEEFEDDIDFSMM
jgi:hypothetical protein